MLGLCAGGMGQACTMPVHGLMVGEKPVGAGVEAGRRGVEEVVPVVEAGFLRFFLGGVEVDEDERALLPGGATSTGGEGEDCWAMPER